MNTLKCEENIVDLIVEQLHISNQLIKSTEKLETGIIEK